MYVQRLTYDDSISQQQRLPELFDLFFCKVCIFWRSWMPTLTLYGQIQMWCERYKVLVFLDLEICCFCKSRTLFCPTVASDTTLCWDRWWPASCNNEQITGHNQKQPRTPTPTPTQTRVGHLLEHNEIQWRVKMEGGWGGSLQQSANWFNPQLTDGLLLFSTISFLCLI